MDLNRVNAIRYRLLVMVLGIVVLAGVTALWRGQIDVQHEVDEVYDAELAKSARVLMGQTLHELGASQSSNLQTLLNQYQAFGGRGSSAIESQYASEATPEGHVYELKLGFQVWDAEGVLLLHTPNVGTDPLSRVDHGYSDIRLQDFVWRVFSMWDHSHRFKVVVAERMDVREELVDKLNRNTLTPALVTFPFLILAIILGISGALSPLRRVAAEVSRRQARFLEPLDVQAIPEEIRPLTEALNDLLVRLRTSFERERRFTADAAHELRTPLAALRAQAQVASRATDPDERERALAQLLKGVERATHLVEQLLTLARLEPEAPEIEMQRVALRGEVVETLADLAPKAIDAGLELELLEGGEAFILGEPTLIDTLVRNLVDNAIRYTPAGGRVVVSVGVSQAGVCLRVLDTGPGIAPALHAHVLERFFRASPQTAEGCGLGLSIVKRIADLHRAQVSLSNAQNDGGLTVEVCFPAA